MKMFEQIPDATHNDKAAPDKIQSYIGKAKGVKSSGPKHIGKIESEV